MSVTAARGFAAAAIACGIKADREQLDLALVCSDVPARWAGCFTQNRVKAAPVLWCEALRRRGAPARAVLINAGNANACWGQGAKTVTRQSARAIAQQLGCVPEAVLVASTGVIGVPLPLERLLASVPALAAGLSSEGAHGERAARAIMTTDLVPKEKAAHVRVGRRTYTVGGMAKGSGMIHPNMATMLAVLTCDAPLTGSQARRLLAAAVGQSFNAISVDGDTSTNDSVFLLCNGLAGGAVAAHSKAEREIAAALQTVCDGLAEAIAIDGEGAKKLLIVHVEGARSHAAAAHVARTVVSSPLVKTAVAGGDPNWGRVLAAAGRAGVPMAMTRLSLRIGGYLVAHRGEAYHAGEADAARHMQGDRVEMVLTVGDGRGTATAKGCDLTYGYIDINAHYRT